VIVVFTFVSLEAQNPAEPHRVQVVSLPPKDSFDLWSLRASIAVAVVGILGVGVGVWTLFYIARQAREMRLQRSEMNAQAGLMAQQLAEMKVANAAAEKSAEAALVQIRAMKDRERARLVIQPINTPEIGKPDPVGDRLRPLHVALIVGNDGLTKAFDVRAYAVVKVVDGKRGGSFEIGFQQELPGTIDNTDGGRRLRMTVTQFGMVGNVEYRSPLYADEETATLLREGQKFLQVSGLLTFKDIFEDNHEVAFKHVWVSQGDDIGTGRPWRNMSAWYALGVTAEEVDEDRTGDISELEGQESGKSAEK
jgi:hypothetical protein